MGDWGTKHKLDEMEVDTEIFVWFELCWRSGVLFQAGITGADTKPAVILTAMIQQPMRRGVLMGT